MNLIATASVCAFLAIAATAQESRAPIPDAAVQARIRSEILEINRADYAGRASADREKLAQRLLGQAATVNADLPGRYVLLQEAMNIAIEVADLPTALGSIEVLGSSYVVDARAMRRAALDKIASVTRNDAEIREIASHWLRDVDESLDLMDLDMADLAARTGSSLAKKAKDDPLCAEFADRRREIAELVVLQERAKRAEAVLARDPDDQVANSEVGKFRCFLRGDWGDGLLRLAKSNHPELRLVAEKELKTLAQNPVDSGPEVCVELADEWWSLADNATPREARCVRLHAAEWYGKALPRLSNGISKMRVEQRIDQTRAGRAAPRALAKEWPEPSPEGLIGKWLFDQGEGTVAVDSSGNGNDGILLGGVTLVDGVVGKAVRFHALGDVVRINLKSALPAANAPLSVTWYQNVEAYPDGDSYVLIALSNGPGKGTITPAAYRPGDRPTNGKVTAWKAGDTIVAGAAPSVKTWHHCAYTYDGKTHRLYIDGRLANFSSASQTSDTPHRLEFGQWCGNDKDQYTGLLDEVRIYSRALKEREVRQLLRHGGR